MILIRRQFALFLFCVMLCSVSISAETLHVPEDYPTIQAAIDGITAGDTIYVAPGCYEERLIIDKSLTLRGEGGNPEQVTILGTSIHDSVVRIGNTDRIHVIIENATITTAVEPIALRALQNYAIEISGKATVTLSNMRLLDNIGGVLVEDGANATLMNCTISENWNGLEAFGFSHTEVNRCAISKNGNGIVLGGSATVSFTDCEISDNRYDGIRVSDSAQVALTRSSLLENESGLVVEDIGQATVHSCRFIKNQDFGIFVASQKAKVSGTPNEMSGNGIDLAGSVSALLRTPLVPEIGQIRIEVPSDYGSLQEAIDAVASGGVVIVKEGILNEGATIWKPLTIEQAQSQHAPPSETQTRELTFSVLPETEVSIHDHIIRSGASYTILIYGACTLHNLCVIDGGSLYVRTGGSASVRIEQCTLADTGWYSLVAGGTATVQSSNTQFSEIEEAGSAQVTLINCSIREKVEVRDTAKVSMDRCASSKLALYDSAQAEVHDCALRGEEEYPLLVKDSAMAHVAESHVCGVSVFNSGEIFLEGCMVSDCRSNGVLATQSSRISLVGCTVSSNQSHGVLLDRSAFARLTRCTLTENQRCGIRIEDGTQLELVDCTISHNEKYGLLILDSAMANVEVCSLSENRWSGVSAQDSAELSLLACNVAKNWLYGLHITESALCTLTSCHVLENGWHGIGVGSFAQVIIQESTLSSNGGDGLAVWESAKVVVQETEISANKGDGIYIEADVLLQIEGCFLTENGEYGLRAYSESCAVTYDPGFAFVGRVVGIRNLIPNESDEKANLEGDICPYNPRILIEDVSETGDDQPSGQ
jgi:parallel beta-helix repeat protein